MALHASDHLVIITCFQVALNFRHREASVPRICGKRGSGLRVERAQDLPFRRRHLFGTVQLSKAFLIHYGYATVARPRRRRHGWNVRGRS